MRMLRYLMDYLDKEYDITQIEDVKPFHIKHFLLLKQEEGKKPQYSDENHYLLGYDGEKVRPYRIDRMEGVKAEKAIPGRGRRSLMKRSTLTTIANTPLACMMARWKLSGFASFIA